MKHFKILRMAALLAGIFTASLPAWAATLKIGDAAPPLAQGKYVQGDPVKSFDDHHVYIVEFWATWCGPCRASIPHLNALWQKFKDKDVIVIGQDCWEQDESGVPAFVQKMGTNMTYRVALDDKSGDPTGAMAVTWMKAAGEDGIPTAFIVNRQGKIAWIGHPMTLEESVLEDILADKFDMSAYARKFEQQQQEQAARQAVANKLRQAMKDKDWDAAEAAVAEMEKPMPASARYQYSSLQIQILFGRGDYAGGYKLAENTSEAHPDNAMLQNQLAWLLATAKGVDSKGLELAGKIANRANAANAGNPEILDTLARIQFMTGQTNEAIASEQKAVDVAPDDMKSYLRNFLKDYQQGKLPETNEGQ